MPDTRKNHNPSGAPVSLSTSCVMWQVQLGLKLWSESFLWITKRGGSIGEQNEK